MIVESNRIVDYESGDLVLFVVAPSNPDWKGSSVACLRAADGVVISSPGELPAQAREHLPASVQVHTICLNQPSSVSQVQVPDKNQKLIQWIRNRNPLSPRV